MSLQADAAAHRAQSFRNIWILVRSFEPLKILFEHLQTLGKSVFKPERAGAAVLEHLQTSENSNRALADL